ncbi:MAG: hypothetical protein PHD46_06815, partial [Eubacteriales bacterium]|nr:hypothetical protein [Eubacteriales bacterium]
MKSVELTKEAWGGVPADKEAFTLDDEKTLFFSKDIQTLPAVLATLKGLRELVSATAIVVKDEAGEDVAAGKELSIGAGDKLKVKIAFTPAY